MAKGGKDIAFRFKEARVEAVGFGGGKRKVSLFDTGTSESIVDILEVNLQKGLAEFIDFLTDLWVAVVQAAARVRPPARPETLFTERSGFVSQKRVTVGWENYPSGAEGALRRFESIKEEWLDKAKAAFAVMYDAKILTSGYSGNVAAVRERFFPTVQPFVGSGTGKEKTSRSGKTFKRGI